MKYGLGECLADYGFNFLEKIHEPIFLVRRSGIFVKMNEAGRKFLRVAQLTDQQLQNILSAASQTWLDVKGDGYRRLTIGKNLQLIARGFAGSDLVMIEIKR